MNDCGSHAGRVAVAGCESEDGCPPVEVAFSSDQQAEAEILGKLAGCDSFADVTAAGFLFHGTAEPIRGPLAGGGWDQVLWTAARPADAQAYIPRFGISTFLGKPADWQLEDRVRPAKGCSVTDWALAVTGRQWEDVVEEGERGVVSYRFDRHWPTLGDLVRFLEEDLGYEANESGVYEVGLRLGDSGAARAFAHAEWSLPGHLVICDAGRLSRPVTDWGPSDLQAPNHHRLEDMAALTGLGSDCFVMGDHLQSRHFGNMAHEAVGILPSGLEKIRYIAIPATNHDPATLDHWRISETPEFAALMAQINPSYRHETSEAGREAVSWEPNVPDGP